MTADARDIAEVAAAQRAAESAEAARRQAAEAQVKAPPGGVIGEQVDTPAPPARYSNTGAASQ
jgi:hypothetical protein